MRKLILTTLIFGITVLAQTEILTNTDIIQLAKAGLGKSIIIEKIQKTKGNYDTTTQGIIQLKESGVDDEIIKLILSKSNENAEKLETANSNQQTVTNPIIKPEKNFLTPKEALLGSRTMAIDKDSLHPSISALEKEILKRDEWKGLNLSLTQNLSKADLLMKVNYIKGSIISHRYSFRIIHIKSGTVVAAGETTSWGSLAKNLGRDAAKTLLKVQSNN